MHTYSFEKLQVWQEAIELATEIYKLTDEFPDEEKYTLVSQMRRCSVSISSNIAEGTVRDTPKDKSKYMTIAYGSTLELLSQIVISKKLKYINDEKYSRIRKRVESITNKINSLKKHFQKQNQIT